MTWQTKETGWTFTPARQAAAGRARRAHTAYAAGRREDYYWLLDEECLPWRLAADRIGVAHRQAQRWNAARACRCGHAAEFHDLSRDRLTRTACSVSVGPKGLRCPCNHFQPETGGSA